VGRIHVSQCSLLLWKSIVKSTEHRISVAYISLYFSTMHFVISWIVQVLPIRQLYQGHSYFGRILNLQDILQSIHLNRTPLIQLGQSWSGYKPDNPGTKWLFLLNYKNCIWDAFIFLCTGLLFDEFNTLWSCLWYSWLMTYGILIVEDFDIFVLEMWIYFSLWLCKFIYIWKVKIWRRWSMTCLLFANSRWRLPFRK